MSVCSQPRLPDGVPSPTIPALDMQWIESTQKKAALKLEKLDMDLKNYKSNSIKESIRYCTLLLLERLFLNQFWWQFGCRMFLSVCECLEYSYRASQCVKKGRPVDKPIDRNWWWWCRGCEKIRQKWLRCPEWSITVQVGLLQVLHRVNKGAPEQVCAEIDNEE